MAIIATVNLALVLFDLSYVRFRDFWLQGKVPILLADTTMRIPLPPVTQWYDPIKGIVPHTDTQQYLEKVNELESQMKETGLRSAPTRTILADLRRMSTEIIEENPFQLANKTGTLERIKNRMRDLIATPENSSRKSFQAFWTANYLAAVPDEEGLGFFNSQIRPLIETNYWRSIDETGNFTNLFFWKLDIGFAILFGLEFLVRTFYISRQRTGVSWQDAMLWRWYDIPLFLPIFQWLRVIPVTIRLKDGELIDLERIREQFSRGFIASFAGELTEVIAIQTINQIQSSVKTGELARQLFENSSKAYIDLNDINEIEAISSRLIQLTIYQVLPAIKDDIEALLRHSIEQAINQLPIYKTVQSIPGFSDLPQRMTEQIVTQVSTLITEGSQSLYDAISNDKVGAELTNKLVQNFGRELGLQIQQQQNIEEIQYLVDAFLEEVKVNYVQNLAREDIEKILEETRRLEQKAKL